MGKKMIILNGSPRKNGNTSALTASFRKGAEKNGNTVVEFFLGDMNINGCRGCFGGGKIVKVLVFKRMIWKKFILLIKRRILLFLHHRFIIGPSADSLKRHLTIVCSCRM